MIMGLGIHVLSVLVLALVADIACRVGRFRPALCHALWLVVLVKLLVPPVLPMPWDALGFSGWYETTAPVTVAKGADGPSVLRIEAVSTDPITATPHVGHDTSWTWVTIGQYGLLAGLAIWAGGSLLFLGNLLYRARSARKAMAESSPPAWFCAQLTEICEELCLSVPPIVITETGCGSVHVQIIGSPTLVVDRAALESIQPEQWPAVLTHEMAHLKRRDHWVAWLLVAATAAWWWNPCLWWVRSRVHRYSELACDSWVVSTRPDDRRSYAETMIQFLALQANAPRTTPTLTLAAWSAADQTQRLRAIMQGGGPARLGAGSTVALAVFALALLPAWIAVSDDGAKPDPEVAADALWSFDTTPSETMEERLKAPADIFYENAYVGDVFAELGDTHGVNIVIDQRAVAPPPGTAEEAWSAVEDSNNLDGLIPYINLKNTELRHALKAIERPMLLTHERFGNIYWISTEALIDSDWEHPLPTSHDPDNGYRDLLAKSVTIEFRNIYLKDALEQLQDRFDFNLVLDKRAVTPRPGEKPLDNPDDAFYVTNGYIRDLRLTEVTLAEALYVLTRQLNLSYSVEAGFVFVSTPEEVASAPFTDREEAADVDEKPVVVD